MIRSALLLCLVVSLYASPACAVINAARPPDALYQSTQTVVVGTVTKFSADSGNLEAAATAVKGTAPGDVLRFKIEGLPAITARIKIGDALVLFMARQDKNAALHLADAWLLPEQKGPALFAVKAEKDLRQSYPGTTATLARLVTLIRDGKYDMLNEVHPNSFKGSVKELGKIDAPGTTALFAFGLGTAKQPTLYAAAPGVVKGFTVTAAGLAPAGDEKLITTDVIAAESVDTVAATPESPQPRTFRLLTSSGKLQTASAAAGASQGKSRRLWTDAAPAVAGAFGLFSPDAKPSVIVIKESGLFLYSLDAAAKSDQPLGDFLRLTGERVETYFKGDKPFAGASAAPLDVNGDGRTDLLIHTATRDLLLINRGHGAFFIHADVGKALVDAAGKPLLAEKTLWTAMDIDGDAHDDLIYLSPDGTLRALLNPKPQVEPKP